MQYLNALGQPILKAAADSGVIAWLTVNEGLEIVYEPEPEQIKLLITQLKKESKELGREIDSKYFDEDYWLNTACRKTNGSCQGGCSSGSCQECCLNSCYCCCR